MSWAKSLYLGDLILSEDEKKGAKADKKKVDLGDYKPIEKWKRLSEMVMQEEEEEENA